VELNITFATSIEFHRSVLSIKLRPLTNQILAFIQPDWTRCYPPFFTTNKHLWVKFTFYYPAGFSKHGLALCLGNSQMAISGLCHPGDNALFELIWVTWALALNDKAEVGRMSLSRVTWCRHFSWTNWSDIKAWYWWLLNFLKQTFAQL
jgi:hypothetical protein